MFMRCQTQWRLSGMGSLLGLDYGAVAWILKLYEVKDQRQLLEGLQTMESAILSAAAKKER